MGAVSEIVLVEVDWRMNAMQGTVFIEETGRPQFEDVRQQLMHLVVEEGAMAQARDIQNRQVLDQPVVGLDTSPLQQHGGKIENSLPAFLRRLA